MKCSQNPPTLEGEAAQNPPTILRGGFAPKPPHYYRGRLETWLEKCRVPMQPGTLVHPLHVIPGPRALQEAALVLK